MSAHSTYTSQDLRLCLIKCCAVSTAARIRRCGCSCVQCLHGGGRGVSDVYARVGAEREREMCRDLKNSVSRAFVVVNCPFAFVLTTLICAIPHWFSPLVPVPFLICSHTTPFLICPHTTPFLIRSRHSISHLFSPLHFSSVLTPPSFSICVKRGRYVSKEAYMCQKRARSRAEVLFSAFASPSLPFPSPPSPALHTRRYTDRGTHSIVREHIL